MLKEWLNTRHKTSSPKGWLVNALKNHDNPLFLLDLMCKDDRISARDSIHKLYPADLELFDQTDRKIALRLKWEYERDRKKFKGGSATIPSRQVEMYVANHAVDTGIRFDPHNTRYADVLRNLGFRF